MDKNQKVKCIDCTFESNLDGAIPVTASCSSSITNPYTLQRKFKHPNFESNINGICQDFKRKTLKERILDWL